MQLGMVPSSSAGMMPPTAAGAGGPLDCDLFDPQGELFGEADLNSWLRDAVDNDPLREWMDAPLRYDIILTVMVMMIPTRLANTHPNSSMRTETMAPWWTLHPIKTVYQRWEVPAAKPRWVAAWVACHVPSPCPTSCLQPTASPSLPALPSPWSHPHQAPWAPPSPPSAPNHHSACRDPSPRDASSHPPPPRPPSPPRVALPSPQLPSTRPPHHP